MPNRRAKLSPVEASSRIQALVLRVLHDLGRPVYTTALVKLVYLIDYFHFRQEGRSATGIEWIFDYFGPNAPSHGVLREAEALEAEGKVIIGPAFGGEDARSLRTVGEERPRFDSVLEAIIQDVVRTYGSLTVEELKDASKQTSPFENARPGRRLVMTRSPHRIPGVTRSDWDRHVRERQLGGGKTIEDLKARYEID